MGNKVIFWRYTVHIHDQIVHEGTPWETIDALRICLMPAIMLTTEIISRNGRIPMNMWNCPTTVNGSLPAV